MRVTLLALLALATAQTLPAQGNSSDPVSRELANVLITTFAIGSPDSLKLRVPSAGFPVGVLPPSAIVMGSINTGDRAITVAETSGPYALFEEELRKALTAAGWTNLPTTVSITAGFTPPLIDTVRSPAALPPATTFCKGTERIEFRRSRAVKSMAVVTMTHTRNVAAASCNANAARTVMNQSNPLPLLAAPPGARVFDGSTGAGNNAYQSMMRLTTTLSLPELMEHYADQFVAHGWTQFADATGSNSATRSFSQSGQPSGTIIAMFTATILPDAGGVQLYVWARRR